MFLGKLQIQANEADIYSMPVRPRDQFVKMSFAGQSMAVIRE
jgi:hypothetical protein